MTIQHIKMWKDPAKAVIREVYTITGLTQEKRKISNKQLNISF